MKRPTKSDEAPEFPATIETFRRPAHYERRNLTADAPSCFNGIVSVRKYRITFEEVQESKEVIAERILRLWTESDNGHDRVPLRKAADEIGLTLEPMTFGTKRPKRDAR